MRMFIQWIYTWDVFIIPVVLWSSICISSTGTEDIKYIFVNESLAWSNAVTYCNIKHRGTLADFPSTVPIEIPPSTNLWVGRYSTYTNWTSITGCYSYTVTTNISPITILLNSVSECQEKCRNHRFIGLRDVHCFCLTREPLDSEGSNECTLTCKGDAANMCGGTNSVVTVYEKVPDYEQISTVTVIAENQQPCGSIESTKQIFQRSCSSSFQALCKSYARQPFHLFFAQQGNTLGYYSWDKSRELCNLYQGNLVDFKVAKTVENNSGSTWIGLFKPSKMFTVEESQPSLSSVVTCTDYLNGVFSVFNSQDCIGLKKSFICKIENKQESSTVTPSTKSYLPAETNNNQNGSSTDMTEPSSNNQMGVIAGVISGVAIIIVLIVVFIIYWTKCRNRPYSDKRKKQPTHAHGDPYYNSVEGDESNSFPSNAAMATGDTGNHLNKTSDKIGDKLETENGIYAEAREEEYDTLGEKETECDKPEPENEIYTEAREGEYDIMGERRLKKSDISTENVYDHTDTDLYHHTDTGFGNNTGYGDDTVGNVKLKHTENVYDHTVV